MIDDRKAWLERGRESIVDLNDGIVTAAGIAEGFAAAGATTQALVFAGATVILTGGFAAAANKYGEERTEWEMNRRLVEAERAGTEHIEPARANVFAAANAGLFFALGAAVPLLGMRWLPVRDRSELAYVPVLLALGLTGWFAAWLTGLPKKRMVLRNLALGATTMTAGLIVGHVIAL